MSRLVFRHPDTGQEAIFFPAPGARRAGESEADALHRLAARIVPTGAPYTVFGDSGEAIPVATVTPLPPLAWGAPVLPFGVLTGAKAAYWPTLAALALACREESVPLAVADHGLTPDQVQVLTADGVLVTPHACPDVLAPARGNHRPPSAPEAWLKPRVCLQSPFERTVWIDADAVPVRDVRGLFELPCPWLTRDWWCNVGSTRTRYGKLLAALGLPLADPRTLHVNSGVFSFHHGDLWILDWATMCDRILLSPDLLRLCGPRDQSALVAVLAQGNGPPLSDDRTLNYPANGLPSVRMHERRRYPTDPAVMLSAVRADHPKARVVHWLGKLKPWSWGTELPPGTFTKDWTDRMACWQPFIAHLVDRPVSVLEIGSHEGRGARWILETLCAHPDARLTCVDVWRDPVIEARWDANLRGVRKVTKLKGLSGDVLCGLSGPFDLIYVDGCHWGRNVIEDAVLAWPLLAPGGPLIFDDYNQGAANGNLLHVAVEGFLRLYHRELQVLHQADQVIVRKR